MANEDLKTFEKSGNLPKLTPVLFNKRKESDILESHRGNYKRHWETSSRLELISNLVSNGCPGSLKPGGDSVEGDSCFTPKPIKDLRVIHTQTIFFCNR